MREHFEDVNIQKAAFNKELDALQKVDDKYDVSALRKLLTAANQIKAQAITLDFDEHYVDSKVLPTIRKLLPEDIQLSIGRLRPKPDTLSKFINAFKVEIESCEQYIADNGVPKSSKDAKDKQVESVTKQLSKASINSDETQKSKPSNCSFCSASDHIAA